MNLDTRTAAASVRVVCALVETLTAAGSGPFATDGPFRDERLAEFVEISPDCADIPPKMTRKTATPMGHEPQDDEDHRHDDGRGLAEQPDGPDDDQYEVHEQPRRKAEFSERLRI